MNWKIYIVLSFITTLVSCGNLDKQIEETVNDSVTYTTNYMTADLTNAKLQFSETYKKVVQVSTDSFTIKKVTLLFTNVNETSKYMDSLNMEIGKLDDKDLRNGDLIEKTFLNEGVGDSIFNKVKLSYTHAIGVALADTTKSRLIKVKDQYSNDTKTLFFSLTTPLGTQMTLYGIEAELIKDATRSLYGYRTN